MCFPTAAHHDAAARWLGLPMNVIGKECLHDRKADFSAAFGEVIAAIADVA